MTLPYIIIIIIYIYIRREAPTSIASKGAFRHFFGGSVGGVLAV